MSSSSAFPVPSTGVDSTTEGPVFDATPLTADPKAQVPSRTPIDTLLRVPGPRESTTVSSEAVGEEGLQTWITIGLPPAPLLWWTQWGRSPMSRPLPRREIPRLRWVGP
ncbi:unnamed protein product [Peronospora belbahrii]|uniref:Uncharacterized protein n=1 Tax=Peronospora belbahrii TaxID=622444 RepID=A0AAU9LB52_9STRA|nr:unnamed protein product [Peronospora belbahrii]